MFDYIELAEVISKYSIAVAVMLTIVSLVVQGPMPVYQGKIGAEGPKESVIASSLTSVVMTVLATVILVAISLKWDLKHPSGDDMHLWLLLVIGMLAAGTAYAVANPIMFQSTKALGGPLFATIFSGRIIPIGLATVVFYDGKATILRALGAVGLMLFVGLAMREKAVLEGESMARGSFKDRIRALQGTFAFGIGNAIDIAIVMHVSPFIYLPIRLIMPVCFIVPVAMIKWGLRPRDYREFVKGRWQPLLAVSLIQPPAALTFMMATALAPNRSEAFAAMHQSTLFVTILYNDWRRPKVMMRYALPAIGCVTCAILVLVG